ncbi:MAG: hypothetical protein ABIQ86_03435 [Steroidobacteraceae bacterium]
MTKTRFMMVLSLLGGLALVTGCRSLGGSGCLAPPVQADTQDRPPLRMPAGLDAPDTREALKIPADMTAAVAPVAGRCLEDPPQIVALSDPTAAQKQSKKEARKARAAARASKKLPGPR